jgi:spore germination protein GerM
MTLAPIMVATLALALSACANSSSASKSTPTTGPVATVTSVPKTTTTVPAQVSTSLYFVRGATLGVAVRLVDSSADPRYLAVQALLAGPIPSESAAGLSTAIPTGTTVRGLQILGGIATINLSPEFVTPGPAPSLSARLAQIVYTLTAYSNVGKVAIEVSKVPLPAFAGVNLSAPVGRSQVTAALPGVLLETPAVGSSLRGTLPISGLTSFTGTYDVQLVDSTGRLLAAVTNSAVVGATFAQTIPFNTSKAGTGTLRVFAKPSTPGQPTQAVIFTLPISP